jgi:hypothetical protein
VPYRPIDFRNKKSGITACFFVFMMDQSADAESVLQIKTCIFPDDLISSPQITASFLYQRNKIIAHWIVSQWIPLQHI